jgi:hypothetical protein
MFNHLLHCTTTVRLLTENYSWFSLFNHGLMPLVGERQIQGKGQSENGAKVVSSGGFLPLLVRAAELLNSAISIIALAINLGLC